MLNRVSGDGEREEDPARSDNQHRIRQLGVQQVQPKATSLTVAVNRLIADNQACGRAEIEFCDDLVTGELRPELQTAIFSIVQELLLNACRHSKSTHVLVGLAQDDDRVCIQVQDWGIGFAPETVQSHKRGLKGVRQVARWLGGTVDIDTRPGAGTCIVVEIPLLLETKPSERACECKPK